MGRDKRHQMTADRDGKHTARERDAPPGAEAVAKLRSMRREILLGVVAQCGLKGETLADTERRALAADIGKRGEQCRRHYAPADKVKVTRTGGRLGDE